MMRKRRRKVQLKLQKKKGRARGEEEGGHWVRDEGGILLNEKGER